MSTNDGNASNFDVNMVDLNGCEWRGDQLSDIEKVFRKAKLRRERLDVGVLGSLGRAWKGSLGRVKGGVAGREKREKRRARARDVEWTNACD